MRGRCVSGHVVRESFSGLDKLGEGGGAFGSGRAVNNFSALMKDVQQPWRVERITRLTEHFYSMHVFIVESPLDSFFSFISLN